MEIFQKMTNFKKSNTLLVVLVIAIFLPLELFSQTNDYLGINLPSITDYDATLTFVDRMKNARNWGTYNADGSGPWETTGITVPMDINGYPTEIPFNPDVTGLTDDQLEAVTDDTGNTLTQNVRTFLYRDYDSYPAGQYTLLFDGEGTIKIRLDAVGDFTDSSIVNHFTVDTPSTAGIEMSIVASSNSNPIRNIRVIIPGYEDIYEDEIFYPLFLERLSGFKSIRFMDWQRTNNNKNVTWADVTTPQSVSQAWKGRGVAPLYICKLANILNIDPWICIPHQANDEYVTELAQLMSDNLNSDLKLYVEYSNELWNYQFTQAHYVGDTGAEQGLGNNDFLSNLHYNSRRSAQIFQIFEQYFGSDQLVRVVASQAANDWTGEQILEGLSDSDVNPTNSRADALAIAPYFAGSVPQDIVANGEVNSISIDEILNRTEAAVYSDTAVWVAENKELTEEFSVELIAYEGGQHLVGVGGNENIDVLTEKLIAANRHERMKDIYLKSYAAWFDNGGSLFSVFSFITRPTKYGSWGILEYLSQPVSEAPKYQATMEVLNNGTPVLLPSKPINLRISN